jgi:ABC-type antimicrobial peptide transport system permease subunit
METSVAAALHRIDASLPLTDPTTLTSFLSNSLGPTRFRGVLLSALAGLGLLLSIVGISGVTSRGVTERTRELGVRLALGSGRFELWSVIVSRALVAVGCGLLAAMPLAFVAVRLLAQWMPGVADVSPWLILPAWALVLAGGTLAAALPALRAARLDPIIALRAE